MRQLPEKVQTFVYLLIITLFVGVIYYPSLSVPFIFDDIPNIVRNSSVHPQNFADLFNAFQSPLNSKRVFSFLSFALNYMVGGLNVYGYHIVNISIHVCNSCILFLAVKQLLRLVSQNKNEIFVTQNAEKIAFWSALLWAVNPVQTQAVTYIVQRMTSLAALFYLFAMYLFIRFLAGRKNPVVTFVLISISFILALGSKEHTATLPATLLLIYWLFGNPPKKSLRFWTLVFITFLLGFIYVYGAKYFPTDWFATYSGRNFSAIERLMSQCRIIWQYLSLYFYPNVDRIHLVYDPIVSKSLFSPITTLFGLLGIVLSLIVAWIIRHKYPVASFAIFFFYMTSSIEASFLNLELVYIHRIYLPSLFLFMGLISFIKEKQFVKIFLLLLIFAGISSYWSTMRNVEWQQASNFWQIEQDRGGGKSRTVNNKIAMTIENGVILDSMSNEIHEALINASSKERKVILFNQAYMLFIEKKHEKSVTAIRKLMKEYGAIDYSPYILGKNLIALGRFDEVELVIGKLENEETLFSFQAVLLKAALDLEREDYDAAERLIFEALDDSTYRTNDKTVKLYAELAMIYQRANRLSDEYAQYLKITLINPEEYGAWRQMYRMLIAGGDEERAEKIEKYLLSKGVRGVK